MASALAAGVASVVAVASGAALEAAAVVSVAATAVLLEVASAAAWVRLLRPSCRRAVPSLTRYFFLLQAAEVAGSVAATAGEEVTEVALAVLLVAALAATAAVSLSIRVCSDLLSKMRC